MYRVKVTVMDITTRGCCKLLNRAQMSMFKTDLILNTIKYEHTPPVWCKPLSSSQVPYSSPGAVTAHSNVFFTLKSRACQLATELDHVYWEVGYH